MRKIASRGLFGPQAGAGTLALLLAVAILLLPETAGAQTGVAIVGFDSAASAQATGSPSSISFSATVNANGLNRAMVVGVSIRKIASESTQDPPTVSSVTFNGVSFTVEQTRNNNEGLGVVSEVRAELWVLVAPSTGTHTVTVTLSRAAESIVAGSVSATNVVQSDPVRSSTNARNAGSSTATETITSATGDLIVDTVGLKGDTSATVGAAQTERWNRNTGTAVTNLTGTGSTEPGASLVTMSWSLSQSTAWVAVALALQPEAVTAAEELAPQAKSYDVGGVELSWRTAREIDNLGFHVYREEKSGRRLRLTPELLAGSALFSQAELASGYAYGWNDPKGTADSVYWIETIDLRGESEWHGPFRPSSVEGVAPGARSTKALAEVATTPGRSHEILPQSLISLSSARGTSSQTALAAAPAVKIGVRETGWYRVGQPALLAAGLSPLSHPAGLQLFVNGRELPILVTGGEDGRFDAGDAIEFYGTALDTPYAGDEVYWLRSGKARGLRISRLATEAKEQVPASFRTTVERKDNLLYYAALANGEVDNIFGSVVSGSGIQQALEAPRVASSSGDGATLEVRLQGVTDVAHAVAVELNGAALGTISFQGKENRTATFPVGASQLLEGTNQVTLRPAGSTDVSLVDSLRLDYPRLARAANDELAVTAQGVGRKRAVRIDGFSSSDIRVVDVTAPLRPVELLGAIANGGIAVSVDTFATRQLYAFTGSRAKSPAWVTPNWPADWSAARRADYLVITHHDFTPAAQSLASFRATTDGYSTAVVDVEDIYDEHSFGVRSPAAIRTFLATLRAGGAPGPRYLVLMGDASFDPRGFLGGAELDFVPTRLIDTEVFEAASDDWFADFDGDDVPELAVGRIPVQTAEQAMSVVQKIVAYSGQAAGSRSALLVTDRNEGDNFEISAESLAGLLPAESPVSRIYREQLGDAAARQALRDGINGGAWLVGYLGHGAVDSWRGGLLGSADAAAFTNADRLSLFTVETCLTGYYFDFTLQTLGESLLRAPAGGAAAVWASTGITRPGEQNKLTSELYRQLFGATPAPTLGEAARAAKLAVTGDVRRTWVLLGDPASRPR